MRAKSGIEIKTPEQIQAMRRAGLVVARTLRVLREAVKPGLSTADLDELADREIRGAGATPSFLDYHGYPAVICTSPNEVIVHGIPRPDAILHEGDIVSIDCGAIVDGWHGDAADHRRGGGDQPGAGPAAAGLRDRAVAGAGPGPGGEPAHRRLARGRGLGPRGRAVRHHRGVRRARHRQRHAHGPAGAQLRAAGPRSQAA